MDAPSPPLDVMVADLRHALDPVAFARERLGFEPDDWQVQALRSPSKRLLLNCSRQTGKSTTTAVDSVHTALYRPGSLTLLVSPSLRQSTELFAKVMGFLRMVEHRPSLDEDNKLSCTLDTGSRVVSLPSAAEKIRGFSAVDLLIEDEAAFCEDALYKAVRPMLAVSGGRLVLMSTPYGRRGHFFEAWVSDEDWERIEVKAKDCPRIPPEFLESERRALGDWWFAQEYECEFKETADQVFSFADVQRAFSDEVQPLFG